MDLSEIIVLLHSPLEECDSCNLRELIRDRNKTVKQPEFLLEVAKELSDVGRDTLVCDAYGIKSQKQFINTLYDNIRFRGAMTTLITDGGRYEISKKVADLLRNLFIKQHESEPYHQHQNKAEQRYGVVKRYINTLMNHTGAPAHCWLLCMLYVCHLLNATASPALGGLTPLQALTGQVPDISHFLHFSF